MLVLRDGETTLVLAPERGGGVLAFRHGAFDVFRPTPPKDKNPWALANFPLVPFSNRIAHGRFAFDGRDVKLQPNFPGSQHPHPIHGQAWLLPWQVAEEGSSHATLHFTHAPDEWPWAYEAEQHFQVSADGYFTTLSLTNRSDTPMPAGLGLHPAFPRTESTVLRSRFTGEWQVTPDGLPTTLLSRPQPEDFWHGQPVGSRIVDTVYSGRQGDLAIEWPHARRHLTLRTSDALSHTVVYVPAGRDFFCVEPVSHMTDAVNRPEPAEVTGLRVLAPGERWEVWASFEIERTRYGASTATAP